MIEQETVLTKTNNIDVSIDWGHNRQRTVRVTFEVTEIIPNTPEFDALMHAMADFGQMTAWLTMKGTPKKESNRAVQ